MGVKFTSYKAEFLADFKLRRKRALEICGGTGERHTKENLTRNHSVITDTLRGGIAHEPRGEDSVAIGSGTLYAPYVELGHNQEPGRYVPAIKKRLKASHVEAKPYLRPAIEGHVDEYTQIINTEMNVK